MSYSVVTSKGQVTIPKNIRERMGIVEGSKLVFVDDGDRVLIYKVESDLAGLYGAVKHDGPPLDFETVKRLAGEAAAKGFSVEGEGKAAHKVAAAKKGAVSETSRVKSKKTGSSIGNKPKVK